MSLNLNTRIEQLSELIRHVKVTNYFNDNYEIDVAINSIFTLLVNVKKLKKNLYIVGNGGSASVAAHATTDFFNVAEIRAITIHESSLLTCLSNDYGYENAYKIVLDQLLNPDDVVIFISSSGKSKNVINAAMCALQKEAHIVTFSGFSHENPLRKLGEINVWLDSNDYGLVEIGHQFILHNIADRFNKTLLD